jgi:hypothetical protein
MGARHAEFALGLWLAISPLVFGHVDDRPGVALHDLLCGTLAAVVSLACYARRLHRAHLALLALAAWLIGYGWWTMRTAPHPSAQNHILVGLTIAMTALIPSRATEPPTGWRRAAGQRTGRD